MPHYYFSWTRSNLRKDMLTAIKELFQLKNVLEIELTSDNATLIRELNGMELEKVIVTNIKLKDEELFYKAKNPKVEEAFGKDDYWYKLDNNQESYITCNCSIYEEVYNMLKCK